MAIVPSTPEGSSGRSRLVRPLGVGLAGSAIGALVLIMAVMIPESSIPTAFSPRWWPQILAGVLIALSVGGFAVAALRREPTVTGEPGPVEEASVSQTTEPSVAVPAASPTVWSIKRLAAVLAATLGYLLLWQLIGYAVATAVFTVGLSVLLGGRGWRALVLFPFVVTVALVLFFDVLLGVPL